MYKITKLQVSNDQRWPSMYEGIFLEPGLVNYKDLKLGIGQLPKPTIDTMLNSFIGKPVVILHQDVTAANCGTHAVGYVVNAFYDSQLGKYKVQFIITKDEAHEKIKNGYELSCAYDITERGAGGRWHALNYDFEIKKGEFTHLALVPNPRYEDSTISPMDIPMLINSVKDDNVRVTNSAVLKPIKEDGSMEFLGFKLFGKKDATKQTLDNSFIEHRGKKISLKELSQAHLTHLKSVQNADDEQVIELKADAEIELTNAEGQPVKIKVSDMLNSYDVVNKIEVKNCAECEGKDGEHMKNCSHYKATNADETPEEKAKREKKEKDDKDAATNAAVLAEAQKIINDFKSGKLKGAEMFKLINAAAQTAENSDNVENGTLIGNSLEDQIARGKLLCGADVKK